MALVMLVRGMSTNALLNSSLNEKSSANIFWCQTLSPTLRLTGTDKLAYHAPHEVV
jgi:hypothetical protein